jgi:uncharacterized membrane protein YbhN (UPF0104 family)
VTRRLEEPPAPPLAAGEPPPAPARRSHLRSWLGAAISLVSLVAVVWWASKQETPRFPTSADRLALVGAAVALYAVATLLRGWRWHRVLRIGGIPHAPADAYALVPVGYMGNTVLPARGGEVLRVILLARREGVSRRAVLGSIVSERLLDAASLVLLFAGLTWFGVAGTPVGQRPALLAVGALVLGALALWGYLALRRRGRMEGFAARIRPLVGGSKPLLGPPGLVLLAVTLAVWLIEGAIFWIVAQSLELDVAPLEGCFLLVLSAFFSLIPAAPGYVGTFDAAIVFGLRAIGVTGGQALSFALLVRFVLFFPVTVVGLGLLVLRYGGVKLLRRDMRDAA